MKIRLRSLETKETLKMEVPNTCTFLQLTTQALSSLSSPSLPSPSITFSLNRKDPLHVSSPDESLRSLGITYGDLIYFSLKPGSSSSFSGNPQRPIIDKPVNCAEAESLGRVVGEFPEKNETLEGSLVNSLGPGSKVSESVSSSSCSGDFQRPIFDQTVNCTEMECLGSDMGGFREKNETLEGSLVNLVGPGSEICGIDGDSADYANRGTPDDAMPLDLEGEHEVEEGVDGGGKRFLEPYFLRRVLREELGGDGSVKKLLVVAVHAVFLESGFVGFDLISGMRVDGFRVVDDWPSKAFTLSLWYTLPELLGNEGVAESVKLKFQSLGNFVNVYGSLAKGGSGLYRVCLDMSKFGPPIDLLWANHGKDVEMDEDAGISRACQEPKVFEFWKIVKDGLAYPLLIELCDKTGLALPPCLMRLPMELKLKILELLLGVDIARMASVCTELQYLSSNNELWKQKFEEEFGNTNVVQGSVNWKARFVSSWVSRKRKRSDRPILTGRLPLFPVIWRDPDPLGFPAPIVGGDYDGFPRFGVPYPFGRRGQGFLRFRRGPCMSPSCNLGGGFNT